MFIPTKSAVAAKSLPVSSSTYIRKPDMTDHYYQGFFAAMSARDWSRKIDAFLAGYQEALDQGGRIGLDVFLGVELRFTEHENDYLVYGIELDFLLDHPCLYDLGLQRFRELIRNREILLYQAHPFRVGMVPAPPSLLDGVEVFNGNPRHDSQNPRALQFARENGLKMISGSDFHQTEDLAGGGIVLKERVRSGPELVKLLKTGQVVEYLGVRA
jgi:predicted metal-dependent phosphoesterase TrpH